MSKAQISRAQFIIALIWCILGTGIVTIPSAVAQFTVRDAWISTLLFSVGGLIAVIVTSMFTRLFPNRTLTSALIDAWGPWIGRALGIWFLLCLYIANCKVVREAEVFVGTTILPKTPEYMIGAFTMIAVAYAVYNGVEVIMRDGEFITPLVMIIALILFFLSMQHMDVHELMPVLVDGWTPVLRGGIVPDVDYALELVIGLQFALFLRNSRTAAKDVGIAAGLVTIVLTLVTVLTIGVVGPSAHYLSYPVLEAVRNIRVGRFLERLDTLYVIAVISTVFVKVAVFHYAWCVGMKDVFHLSSHRVTALSGALLVWGGATVLFGNAGELQQFISYTMPFYFVVTFICIPLLAAAAMAVKVRVKRGNLAATRRG